MRISGFAFKLFIIMNVKCLRFLSKECEEINTIYNVKLNNLTRFTYVANPPDV